MPRNASGTYSTPTGNPVVTGTAISSTVHNATVADIAAELTDSLSRSGKGGMLVPLGFSDGIVSAPGVTFNSETNTGLWRAGAGDVRLTILGVNVMQWVKSGASYVANLVGNIFGANLIQPVDANTALQLKGNRTDISTGTDIVINTSNTRTDGNLVDIQNNGSSYFTINYLGQVTKEKGLACGYSFLNANIPALGAGFANVMSFNVEASGTYVAEVFAPVLTAAAGSIPQLRWTGPAAPTAIHYDIVVSEAGGTAGGGSAAAFSTAVGSTVVNTTTAMLRSNLVLVNGANAGVVQLQAQDSVGTMTVYAGAFIRWRRLA